LSGHIGDVVLKKMIPKIGMVNVCLCREIKKKLKSTQKGPK